MKKQYQLVIGILVISVFFCTNQKDNLKACGSNTSCATILKKDAPKTEMPEKNTPAGAGYNEEADGGIYRFMNPFVQ